MELAMGSSDRQTKVSASEMLHFLVLYMVGTNAVSSKRKSDDGPVSGFPNAPLFAFRLTPCKTQFYKIYQHVFPVLLTLATDLENVTRQLFEPLVAQLIHWFTKNQQYHVHMLVRASSHSDQGPKMQKQWRSLMRS